MKEFIEGITVLNETPVYGMNKPLFIIAFVVLIVGTVVSITLACVFKEPNYAIGIMVSILAFVIIGAISNNTGSQVSYYEYDVLIDETVNMREFYDKYEIINKSGEIFKIKLK